MTQPTKEQLELIASQLPPLSKKVYDWINTTGLYAEPGFTDLEVHEIDEAMGLPVGVARGCVGHLVKVGLAYIDETEVNDDNCNFVGTFAHYYGYID